jgi:hypothetical protein
MLSILFCIISISNFIIAQTKEIHQKNNCSKLSIAEPEESFGQIIRYYTSYKKLNSKQIEVCRSHSALEEYFPCDTVYMHPILCDPKLNMDTINKYYDTRFDSFVGFDFKIKNKGAFLSDDINLVNILSLLLLFAIGTIAFKIAQNEA